MATPLPGPPGPPGGETPPEPPLLRLMRLVPHLSRLRFIPSQDRWLANVAGYPAYEYLSGPEVKPAIDLLVAEGQLLEVQDYSWSGPMPPDFYIAAAALVATGGCSKNPDAPYGRVQVSLTTQNGYPFWAAHTCRGNPVPGDPRFKAVDTKYGVQYILAEAVRRVMAHWSKEWCWLEMEPAGSWFSYWTTPEAMGEALGL